MSQINAEQSSGFEATTSAPPDLTALPPRVRQMVDRCRRDYDYLLNFALS